MNLKVAFALCLNTISIAVFAQRTITLAESMAQAKENSTTVAIAKQSLKTRMELNAAAKKNMLPKVDLLAGYNHLGDRTQINLQSEKESVVNQASGYLTGNVGNIYQQATGNTLPTNIQQLIYETSQNLIRAVYPQGNLDVGKEDYVVGGIFVRQPIYLGGKLKAGRELAEQQVVSGQVNLENTQQLAAYNTALQYIRLMYLNTMLHKQNQLLQAQKNNSKYAAGLLHAEIIPPYLKNWADIAEQQALTNLQNLKLEKENGLYTFRSLAGKDLDDNMDVTALLPEALPIPVLDDDYYENTDVRLLSSKKAEAEATERVTGAIGKPNIFAIGNVQFFRKDLPIILPSWLVGVELQWTLFDTEKKSRNLAARSLVAESNLLIEQKREATELALRTTQNTLNTLRQQAETLNQSRRQADTTTQMVRKRMENALSSVKDVNDALILQYEAEKLYYTNVVAYEVALATYYYLRGRPEDITQFIQ